MTEIAERLAEEAANGNVQAARLLFDACGFIPKDSKKLEQTTHVLIAQAREQEGAPQTVAEAFEVIDEQYKTLQRYRRLIEIEQTGELEAKQ